MAKIIIPTPLRKFTDNNSVYETNGSNIQEAISDLAFKYAGLRQHLFDGEENLRSFIKIYLGDEDINSLKKGATPVHSDAVISIVPAIAGGTNL